MVIPKCDVEEDPAQPSVEELPSASGTVLPALVTDTIPKQHSTSSSTCEMPAPAEMLVIEPCVIRLMLIDRAAESIGAEPGSRIFVGTMESNIVRRTSRQVVGGVRLARPQ